MMDGVKDPVTRFIAVHLDHATASAKTLEKTHQVLGHDHEAI